MRIWHLPQTTHQLGCWHKKKVSQQSNHGKQYQLQIGVPAMQPLSSNSNPMLHPIPSRRPNPPVSPSHIWRIPMSKWMGGLLGTYLQPSDSNPTQWLMGPNQTAFAYPKFSPATKNNGRQRAFWHWKGINIDVKENPRGTHDIYINSMIPLTVDILGTDNLARCAAAGLLAIHATAWPKHPKEPIPQEEMEARNKLSAEARLKEEKIILGWWIDFCHLIISLPDTSSQLGQSWSRKFSHTVP